MLRLRKRQRCWALLVLSVCIVVILDWDISFYPLFADNDRYAERDNRQYECCGLFKGPIIGGAPRWVTTAVQWVDDNEGFITAGATVAIAAFTLTLWLATRGLFRMSIRQDIAMRRSLRLAKASANAAKQSADAAVDFSRPVLLPRVIYSTELTLPRVMPPEYRPEIHFTFENYGKGVAIIVKVTSELLIFEDEPPETRQFIAPGITNNRVVVPGEYKIEPGRVDSLNMVKARTAKIVTAEEYEMLGRPRAPFRRFYLVGVVEYEDLFRYDYEGGFCLKVFPNAQGARGGAAFNYYKYKKKNDPS